MCAYPPELVNAIAALFREPLPGDRPRTGQTPIEIAADVLDVVRPYLARQYREPP